MSRFDEHSESVQLTGPRCFEQHEWFGAVHTCVRPLDHDGEHGAATVLVDYSLTWPAEEPHP